MIITREAREVETNIETKAMSFGIDNDSHVIFEGLRKTLYPEPIRAIAREILSNALDAQIENNTEDQPVEISFAENYLVIRDHGIGISPDRMENVFCWYGRSSKSSDNSQIGGFGIGAKSVWSAVDSFIVETTYNGIQYTYNAYIGESLKGDMLLMHSEKVDSPSGTAIKIPYNSSQRYEYRKAIKESTRFWKVPPTFHGELKEPPFLPTLNGDKWAIYLKDVGGYNILCGTIPYKDYGHNIPARVVLKFEIGEIDLVLNRDSIRATDKTNKAIKDRLELFNKEVTEEVQSQLNSVETFGEVLTIIDSIPGNKFTQRMWKWHNCKFQYPFSESVTIYERPRQKLSSYRTKILTDGAQVTDQHFIELDKTLELTSYDRQKIGYYLNQSGLRRIYLIPPGMLPVSPIKLTTIKIVRAKSTTPKRVKSTIKGKEYRNKRQHNYLIDTPNVIVYITDRIESLRNVHNLGKTIVEIAEKDVKYINDEENWIPLDEYLQQELYDKLTTEQIQSIADSQKGSSTYENFSFLVGHHGDFDFLKKIPIGLDGTNSARIMNLVTYLVDNGKVTSVVPDLYKTYPMLRCVRYPSYDERQTIKDYIDIVNKSKIINP